SQVEHKVSVEQHSTVSNTRIRSTDIERIIAVGRVEPEDQITTLSLEVAGIVKAIAARDGDTLQHGAVILELDHAAEDARLRLAQARVETQRSDITSIRAEMRIAEAKLLNYKERYERLRSAFSDGAETRQNLDNAYTDYTAAQQEVERLRASLQSAESRLRETQCDVRIAYAELQRKILRAPSHGILLKLSPNVGSAVAAGVGIGEFAPSGALTVLCEVDELFAGAVAPGQDAIIRRQGSMDTLATGTVMSVGVYLKKKSLFSDDANALEDRRVREVRIRLHTAHGLLLNSRVDCIILVHGTLATQHRTLVH
ncbi:MAG: hypothetical protein RML40_12255, partial [Bacteroidota bacterium]|nr:hypothetical protein [Candidatus Kapabacteria bacterium]MDW8221287.1 hypothetical protein [Bacteroidota bacterium]